MLWLKGHMGRGRATKWICILSNGPDPTTTGKAVLARSDDTATSGTFLENLASATLHSALLIYLFIH